MKKSKLAILIVIILCLSGNIQAQEKESPFSVSCDFMSRYIWRGMDFGASPSIQPGVEYSKGNLSIGAWGAFTTNAAGVQEADLYISYAFSDQFSFTITDYFFPDETNTNYQYFDYRDKTTGHVFEATLSFNGTEKLPLSFFIATNFYGADARKINADQSVGKIQYSTYAELSYAFKNTSIFMGVNLTNPDETKGEIGYYGNAIGITNLGVTVTKNIKITDSFELPLTVSLITNPQAEKIFMVAGISF